MLIEPSREDLDLYSEMVSYGRVLSRRIRSDLCFNRLTVSVVLRIF